MKTIEFSGFRDLASADKMVVAMMELYGSDAAAAAADCARAALADRRTDDYCFWLVVRRRLEQ